MKKQLIITTVFVAGLLGFSQTADAGHFRDRQQRQEHRIEQGIAAGQITPREAHRLYRDQRDIRQLKRHYRSDGHLSKRERKILEKRLDRSSERIYRLKNNHRQVERSRYSYHPVFALIWR
jgi:hypothetical protein